MTKMIHTALAVLSLLLITGTAASAQSSFEWIVDEIDVYNMEVVDVVGRRLTVRIDEIGKRTFQVPKDFRFYIAGKPMGVGSLQPRQKLTAYVTRTSKGLVLADAGPVRATPPAQPPKTPIVATVVPAPAAAMLPSTGSLLPLIGLSGIGALLIAGLARRLRVAS